MLWAKIGASHARLIPSCHISALLKALYLYSDTSSDKWLYDHVVTSYIRRYWRFSGCPLELKWLPLLLIFLGFSCFFHHFEGQQYRTFYCKNHCHYSNLIANQRCYTFWHVLLYFRNENELTKLIPLVNRRNYIFMYKHPYLLTSKMANFLLLTWLQTNDCVTHKTSIYMPYVPVVLWTDVELWNSFLQKFIFTEK